MFREIREIKKEEKNLKDYGYLSIKPKKKLSDSEMNEFWKLEFAKEAELHK